MAGDALWLLLLCRIVMESLRVGNPRGGFVRNWREGTPKEPERGSKPPTPFLGACPPLPPLAPGIPYGQLPALGWVGRIALGSCHGEAHGDQGGALRGVKGTRPARFSETWAFFWYGLGTKTPKRHRPHREVLDFE